MQEIIRMAAGDQMVIPMPPPTWIDGWVQFYSNLSQMGTICAIFLFMGCICGERQSGSAALTLTKNLSHTNFVMAKFIAAASLLFVSIILAVAVCYGYIYFLFGFAGNIGHVLLGAVVCMIFMLNLLGVTMLSSALAKSSTTSAMLAFFSFLVLVMSSNLPVIGNKMPGILINQALAISTNEQSTGILYAVAVSLCISALCLIGAVRVIKKQEI
jgi:ABC-2 type transport system permease protein